MKRIKIVLWWIWELPQCLLGLLVKKIDGTTRYYDPLIDSEGVWLSDKIGGVSLGEIRIVHKNSAFITIRHEYGHTRQSRRLGWLYLLVIGLPSITFNGFDRLFHKKWDKKRRQKWYYSLPWEAWADKLGKVERSW